MEFELKNKGVYELTRKEALGRYFCTDNNESDKVIVSYFISKKGEIIKSVFEDNGFRDYVSIYFSNTQNAENKEILESILRSLCLQINNTRTDLKRRSENTELSILVNYTENCFENELERDRIRNLLMENPVFETLGYKKLEGTDIHTGHSTKHESERLLKEPQDMAKYNFSKKLYEANRDDYLSWDEYFLASAKLCALRSKDPSTQVGACIVGEDNVILSMGYNGAPTGWDDAAFPWDRTGEYHDTKYPLVVHAEANAILHCVGAGRDLKGARIYVDLFPCNQCAQLIAQSGIKEVIYLCDKYAETDAVKASKRLFDNCGVSYRQLNPEKEITLTLKL